MNPLFRPQVEHKIKWIDDNITHRDVSIEQGEVAKWSKHTIACKCVQMMNVSFKNYVVYLLAQVHDDKALKLMSFVVIFVTRK